MKNIPAGVNERLSRLSSCEAVFNAAAPPYQQALSDSGNDRKLRYDPVAGHSYISSKDRTRTSQITWFNPPFSLNIETNVGKDFFKIIDNFLQNNILAPIINRSKVKLSYRTMKNMIQIISSHNVTREDTGTIEHYTGLTGGTFKTRWYGHMSNIRTYDPEDGSYGKRISRYVGDLNCRKIPNTITWSIICRTPTYNPVTKSCRLCLMEKFLIMFEPSSATLNVKSEFFSSCLHRKRKPE